MERKRGVREGMKERGGRKNEGGGGREARKGSK